MFVFGRSEKGERILVGGRQDSMTGHKSLSFAEMVSCRAAAMYLGKDAFDWEMSLKLVVRSYYLL